MGYVVVVLAIINTAALVAMGVVLFYITKDMPGWVETAIQDEVRRQDDRIEKRAQRASGQEADMVPTAVDGLSSTRVRAGQPTRR